ncbi:mandelate racemase/muconate lactonizing enzyme family protein [bacterium]|nr:MAG: mandelate racemase/muconate lactonizing enzyme family protein [bacterium]
MKITKVRAVTHEVQNVITGWKISLGSKDNHELIFVRVDTDEKIFGVGVASPGAIYISGDTGVHHLELINNVLGPAIVGVDPFELEAITRKLDSLTRTAERAKAGIDLALHDLMGKALGVPANKLFGGAVHEGVRVNRLMGMFPPREMAEKCKAVVQQGYTALKLKVGTTLKEDVERVQRVREAVGPEVTITIDFNQACFPKEAIQRIQKMEPYDVAIVEQPVKAADLKGMALVRQSVKPRVMADESVNNSVEALRIIETGAADIISLKIPKMGGIFKARKVAAVCEAAGIEYLVGTAPGSRLLDAANVHLAVSLRNLTLPCEIGEFERMAGDPCKGLEIVDGYSRPPAGPGLGIEVDLGKIGLEK